MTKVAFLGDSITAGYGLHHLHSYPSVVGVLLEEKGLPIEVLNEGVSGNTTADGLRRLPKILEKHPDILIVALGGNDMLRGIDNNQIKNNLNAIIENTKRSHIQCLLLGMKAGPFYGMQYMETFNEIFDTAAREHNVPYLPFFIQEIALQAEFNQTDGIHPNSAGQRKLAERVANFIADVISPTASSQLAEIILEHSAQSPRSDLGPFPES